jgi:hypothetical protein
MLFVGQSLLLVHWYALCVAFQSRWHPGRIRAASNDEFDDGEEEQRVSGCAPTLSFLPFRVMANASAKRVGACNPRGRLGGRMKPLQRLKMMPLSKT